MFYKKWDDMAIINHIISKHGRKPLNSSYYATNYPAVYAAAERTFGSWKNAIEACEGTGVKHTFLCLRYLLFPLVSCPDFCS